MLQKDVRRNVGVSPAYQDRGRLACMRLYSTADERGLYYNSLFVCLAATCSRDGYDPPNDFLLQKNYA
ncbi:MAG: hypothetical protein LBP59_07875 [Planctomycetaceae bacterium]|nr:hypothetical protein [Planctomycetaceae bacterium]